MDTEKLREAIEIFSKANIEFCVSDYTLKQYIEARQTLIDFAQRGIEVAGVMPKKKEVMIMPVHSFDGKVDMREINNEARAFNEAIDLCTLAMAGKDKKDEKVES